MRTVTFTLILLILISTPSLGNSSSINLTTLNDPGDISGNFDLILVGGTYKDDPDRMAILDVPGDDMIFKPVTDQYRVKRIKNISAEAALEKARTFFSDHCAYNGFSAKTMTLPTAGKVGYQLVPDYPTVLCEHGNEISISYGKEKGGIIKVYTWLLLKEGNDFRLK